ncbi:polar amino acid transport system permease protein [Rhizobium sp. BK313]|uniref:amino acid ABC transporter permease n=1 Tax=Rhizobium sp. BK313 TaxID=2587081 RepID=UPI001060DA05|nr:amino acid ABC transporter permease [Rhizobium sp. BK313]MBB3454349.1 polar amino acid transport system permease protein [Rhizobium sp. BK313]
MDFDFSPVLDSWQYLLGGFGVTLLLSAATVGFSLVLGTAVALGRVYGPVYLRLPLTFYIDSMRAIPVLVVLVWIYFALPILSGVNLPPFWAATVALSVHIAAYVAEIIRAGIESVRQGQIRAGKALGMSSAQITRKIVLPQALIRMLPAFGSIISITIKDTAIASVIAVPELIKRSETVAGQSYRPMEVFTVAMVAYFLLLLPITRMIDLLYRRFAHLGRS